MRELSPNELQKLLAHLIDAEALELIRADEGKIYIPYIMNDAVEAYCTLTGCIVPSALPDDVSMATHAELSGKDGRTGLFVSFLPCGKVSTHGIRKPEKVTRQ